MPQDQGTESEKEFNNGYRDYQGSRNNRGLKDRSNDQCGGGRRSGWSDNVAKGCENGKVRRRRRRSSHNHDTD